MKTKTYKIYSIILIVVFIGVVFTPLIIRVLKIEEQKEKSESENRMLAAKPIFDIEKLDPFPKGYELWFNDHFFKREQLLFLNNIYNFYIGKSPSPQNVVLGKHEWLYYNIKERDLYEGKFSLSDDSIALIKDELVYRTNEYTKRGIKFYVMIVPIKKEIYPEFLPNYIQRTSVTVTDKIINCITNEKSINLITCKDQLLQEKKKTQVYFKHDNHWNSNGAYIAYKTLISKIAIDFPNINIPVSVVFQDFVKKGGNMAKMIILDTMLIEQSKRLIVNNPKAMDAVEHNYPPVNNIGKDEYEIAKKTDNSLLPKAVIIRDSFFGEMIPLVSEHFSKTVFIFDAWQYGYNIEIVEAEKPDIVILEVYEPHLSNILNNLSHKQKK